MDTSRGSKLSHTTLTKYMAAGSYCLTFWYLMYGKHVNTLQVLQSSASAKNIIWEQRGSISKFWQQQVLSISSSSEFHVS